MAVVISFVGNSNSGKTTLVERLIPILREKGFRIGTIKHAHKSLSLDSEGKDSVRHFAAGADTSIAASDDLVTLTKRAEDISIDSLIKKYMEDVDLVITEGYKTADKPKVEVVGRNPQGPQLCYTDDSVFAVVAEAMPDCETIWFRPGEVNKLAKLIEDRFLA